MVLLRSFLLLLFLSTLAGCGSLVEPGTLRKPDIQQTLSLPADVLYTFQADKPVDERYYTGLLAGEYVAEFEDDGGTYFRGPGRCVVWADVPANQQRRVAEGGLWLAKGNTTPKFKIYRYLATEGVQARSGVPGAPTGATSVVAVASAPGSDVSAVIPIFVPVTATPFQAGIGSGIAAGVIALTAHTDDGKIAFQRPDPPPGTFDGRITRP
jgi:hypothetical protein